MNMVSDNSKAAVPVSIQRFAKRFYNLQEVPIRNLQRDEDKKIISVSIINRYYYWEVEWLLKAT